VLAEAKDTRAPGRAAWNPEHGSYFRTVRLEWLGKNGGSSGCIHHYLGRWMPTEVAAVLEADSAGKGFLKGESQKIAPLEMGPRTGQQHRMFGVQAIFESASVLPSRERQRPRQSQLLQKRQHGFGNDFGPWRDFGATRSDYRAKSELQET
jgi:hypothetical protein